MAPATTQPMPLMVRSTNVVRLRRLRAELSGAFITNATVTCTLLTEDGNAVPGAIDVPMPYAAGTMPGKGEYRGTIGGDVDLTVGARYDAEITAEADGNERVFHLACIGVEG